VLIFLQVARAEQRNACLASAVLAKSSDKFLTTSLTKRNRMICLHRYTRFEPKRNWCKFSCLWCKVLKMYTDMISLCCSALDDKASNLASLSQKYKKDAHYLNLKSSYFKIAAIVVVFVVILLFIRYWFFWHLCLSSHWNCRVHNHCRLGSVEFCVIISSACHTTFLAMPADSRVVHLGSSVMNRKWPSFWHAMWPHII